MAQTKTHQSIPMVKKRSGVSLSVRISSGLMFAAIIPLFLTLAFTYLVTRPALIDHYTAAMQSDASTRVQLINNYLKERVGDVQTFVQVPTIQIFLASPVNAKTAQGQELILRTKYALVAGTLKDKNYEVWALFSRGGQQLLAYSPQNSPFTDQAVPDRERAAVANGQVFISPVSYLPEVNKAVVNIYAPISRSDTVPGGIEANMLGFVRVTLSLDYIWNEIVQKDLGNNGVGSYAFILDENGIRIADTDATERFTSVASLPPNIRQQITQEARFGTQADVPVKADTLLAQHLSDHGTTATFQEQPAGRSEDFQVVRQATDSTLVPWNYFVLSPIKAVTSLATQQLIITVLVVIAASFIVVIIGLLARRRLTRPILSAVASLENNSDALTTLATNQQDAAAGQVWVVESSQTGLEAVQYYTEASKVALQRLHVVAAELVRSWKEGKNNAYIGKMLELIIHTTKYLEKATEYQDASNQRLATALNVATQVTEQLHNGTTSATLAATQLEEVVSELCKVVGH
jgi:hypothetical protein